MTSDETYRGQEVGVLQHMQHDDVAGGLVGRDHSPHLYLHVILPKVLPHHLVLPQQLTQNAQTLTGNLPLYATNKINISLRTPPIAAYSAHADTCQQPATVRNK